MIFSVNENDNVNALLLELDNITPHLDGLKSQDLRSSVVNILGNRKVLFETVLNAASEGADELLLDSQLLGKNAFKQLSYLYHFYSCSEFGMNLYQKVLFMLSTI